jgi:hypothetical protein
MSNEFAWKLNWSIAYSKHEFEKYMKIGFKLYVDGDKIPEYNENSDSLEDMQKSIMARGYIVGKFLMNKDEIERKKIIDRMYSYLIVEN